MLSLCTNKIWNSIINSTFFQFQLCNEDVFHHHNHQHCRACMDSIYQMAIICQWPGITVILTLVPTFHYFYVLNHIRHPGMCDFILFILFHDICCQNTWNFLSFVDFMIELTMSLNHLFQVWSVYATK